MKIAPSQAVLAQMGSRGVALVILILGTNLGLVDNATPLRLYLREREPVPIVLEVGWVPEPVWAGVEKKKSLTLPGVRTRTFHPVHS
jgi:hypothetical protein